VHALPERAAMRVWPIYLLGMISIRKPVSTFRDHALGKGKKIQKEAGK
jgi:hypothetical protein